MNLVIIAAVSENNVIGLKGKIPWHIPEDLQRFRQLTLDHPVIMGENTFFSIMERNGRPLPKRKNIVLSETLGQREGIHVARNMEEAISLAGDEETYIIGGERVYRDFLPLARRMELTEVYRNFEGDAFFPKIKKEDWALTNISYKVDKELLYSFSTYNRR